jgi:hypothetical protein
MQYLQSLRYGINAGMTERAKQLLRPAVRAVGVSCIINFEQKRVDGLHMVTRQDGETFVEVVQSTAERHGLVIYFLALRNRAGEDVPESHWTHDQIKESLSRLQVTIDLALAMRTDIPAYAQ